MTKEITFPLIYKITFNTNQKVSLNMGDVWVDSLDLTVTAPYPATVQASRDYMFRVIEKLEAVPFENLASNQENADRYNEVLDIVKNQLRAYNEGIEIEGPGPEMLIIEGAGDEDDYAPIALVTLRSTDA